MIVDVPSLIAVIFPLSTLTTVSSELVQITFLFVAFVGNTLANKVEVSPIYKSKLFLDNEIEVTLTVCISSWSWHNSFFEKARLEIPNEPFLPQIKPLTLIFTFEAGSKSKLNNLTYLL